jgi:hypothetical protein
MIWTRREFLGTALTGLAILPLARKGLPSDVFRPADGATYDDYALLDELQRASFDFFWNEADPVTGLVRDRANAEGGGEHVKSSIAATGFGLTALCIGHHRRYRQPDEIVTRVRQALHFLAEQAPQVEGFLYHFVEMQTGQRKGNSELSPIDMAILLAGALTCRAYFFDDEQIQRDATTLYHRVNWPWALNGSDTFALAWRPGSGFSHLRWDAYCESMMLYLLAVGSPTYPIPERCWRSIRRPAVIYGDYRFISTPAPLFVHQFSHAWFDFRDQQDDFADYFENSVVASHAHRRFCHELSSRFPSYSEKVWGITASDSSRGYVVWGGPPSLGPIDGTVVPAAAAGSLPFIFNESMSVLRNLRDHYGDKIWRRYGFVDAFNPLTGWASRDVLGIDVGISMLMAENARSQFVWNTFMRNNEARFSMQRVGFRPIGANSSRATRRSANPKS